MASILKSAQRSIAAGFDAVAVTAESGVRLIKTGASSIEALDIKVTSLVTAVNNQSIVDQYQAQRKLVMTASAEMTELLREEHAYLGGKTAFDAAAAYKAESDALTKLLA